MFDTLLIWAGQGSTAWIVLAGAALIFLGKAARESQVIFWSEFTEDDESAV